MCLNRPCTKELKRVRCGLGLQKDLTRRKSPEYRGLNPVGLGC
jgi:hypothetical protein